VLPLERWHGVDKVAGRHGADSMGNELSWNRPAARHRTRRRAAAGAATAERG
jgi:hypothetical protein